MHSSHSSFSSSSNILWKQKIKPKGLVTIYQMTNTLKPHLSIWGVKLVFENEAKKNKFKLQFLSLKINHLHLEDDIVVNWRTNNKINNILQLELNEDSYEAPKNLQERGLYLLAELARYVDISGIPQEIRDAWMNLKLSEIEALDSRMPQPKCIQQ